MSDTIIGNVSYIENGMKPYKNVERKRDILPATSIKLQLIVHRLLLNAMLNLIARPVDGNLFWLHLLNDVWGFNGQDSVGVKKRLELRQIYPFRKYDMFDDFLSETTAVSPAPFAFGADSKFTSRLIQTDIHLFRFKP